MMLAGLSLLLPNGPLAEPPALPFHSLAFVNDPLSHGTVGDALLSLNEAIRLHNNTLSFAALSPLEQAQLSIIPNTGSTTDVTWIDIDGSATPVITIEQDLDPVLDTTFGLLIRGFGERPVLDFSGPGITAGIYAPTNAITIENVHIVGGPYGVRVVQTDVTGQPGAVFQDVWFDGQTQYGARITAAAANGIGRVVFDRCQFTGAANAIEYSDTGADRTTIFEARDCRITGATWGIQGAVGPRGSGRFTFERIVIDGAVHGISLQLPTSSGRPMLLEGTHVRIRARTCLQSTAAPDAPLWLSCSMWHLLGTGPAPVALQVGALGDQVFGDVDELSCVGAVSLAAGGASLPLSVRNARCRDGGVALWTTAAQPFAVSESRFTDCQTDTGGGGVIAVADSCFVGGSLGTTGTAGAWQLLRCYVQNPGPAVVQSQSVPAPQLGSVVVTPDDVVPGAPIQLGVDLPTGLVGLVVVGAPAAPVPALPAPFWVYVDLTQFVIVPGVFTLQQAYTWNVPNLPQFVGLAFVAQALVLPTAGFAAPWLQLPPGWRFELR